MSLSIVEQIKSRLDIIDVISSYIKVEKSGINWKARCPFHNEKTPSFFISQSRQNFYCFGCHEKGDLISFVEKYEGLDFKGAIENLALKAHIELNGKDFGKKADNKNNLFKVMERAVNHYELNLLKEKDVLRYLKERGLEEETVKKWRLGYAKDLWRDLCNTLLEEGFEKEDLITTGLLKKTDGEEKYYDVFRGRIMFPIFDSGGRTIAFSGRTLSKDKNIPKYLNSKETVLFYKSEVLYGFNIAKEHIRKLDYSVLVEGQMDLIMSHQSGINNTVASSGTAITESHLKKLQRLSNRIIIAFDGDKAGERASKQTALLAIGLGMEVKIAIIDKDEDPASIIKKDKKMWRSIIKNSAYYTDNILKMALNENNEKDVLKSIYENVLPVVLVIKNEIEKETYVKKIASKLKVSEESVWNDIEKRIKSFDSRDNSKKEFVEKSHPIEKILSEIIIFEEETKKRKSDLRKKLSHLIGEKESNEMILKYEENKDSLLFKLEELNNFENLKKIGEDALKRMELDFLKKSSIEIANMLDAKKFSVGEEKKLKMKFKKVQSKIEQLSS